MADRYWVGGASDTVWNRTTPITNWGTASGVRDNASVPTAADNTIFDGGWVGGCAIVGGQAALSLFVSSVYTGNISFSATLTVSGNVTLGANQGISGTANLALTGNGTLTSNGRIFTGNLQFNGGTKTLADDWEVNGNIIISNTSSVTMNGFSLTGAGISLQTFNVSGTTDIILKGGTWVTIGGDVLTDLIFAGNVTVSGTVTYGTRTLTYQSGTITVTGSTLSIIGSCTLDTTGMGWNTITIDASVTITLLSILHVQGTLSITGAGATLVFAGTAGFLINTLTANQTTTTTVTLKEAIEYIIQTSINITLGRIGTAILFTSSHATNKSLLTLRQGATCTAIAVNFTRIDAGNGRTINTWNGVVTDCININSFTDYKTTAALTF